MKTLSLRNGDQMPIVGLGTWKSGPGEAYAAVREAIRIGYRHIDCAMLYGNEAEIGSALADAISDGDVTRKDLWITSKLWGNHHGRANVEPTLRKSLHDLGLDYLDLYLVHWPMPLKPDATIPVTAASFASPIDVPITGTWAGFEDAVAAGLTRHIGVSNFSAKKIAALSAACTIKPEVNQVELHPLLQQPELVAYCASQSIIITAYSPLGSGDRPAFAKAADAPVLLDDPVIRAIAEAHGCTPAQVLIAWHVNRGISTVPKSVTPARLRENFAAADIKLSAADLDQIAALNRDYRLISGRFWVVEGGPWTLESIWDGP
jgi:alcohol dehydrogenase (NADP+)